MGGREREREKEREKEREEKSRGTRNQDCLEQQPLKGGNVGIISSKQSRETNSTGYSKTTLQTRGWNGFILLTKKIHPNLRAQCP
jgi:hypothetical protein